MKINNLSSNKGLRKNAIEEYIVSLANFLAIVGIVILLFMVFVNIISILGRLVLGKPLVGDFELIEIACGVSIFMFLPICHLKNGHIIVDAFSFRLSFKKRLLLDLFSDILFGLVALFFSSRMIFGLLDMAKYNEQTMLLEIPVWILFGPAIFSLFFLSFICFWVAMHKTEKILFGKKN